MRRDARSLGLVLGSVALVAMLIVGIVASLGEQHRLDQAREDQSTQRDALRTARLAMTRQNESLHTAYVTSATLVRQLSEGNNDVSTTQAAVATANAALAQARAVFNEQSGRRAAVGDCLTGVKLALDATRAGNSPNATLYLRVAAPACQRALTPPGESAPALAFDFADPYVLRVGTTYFAFATNAAGGSVQEAQGTDLNRLNLVRDALHNIPSWAKAGTIWAPAALVRGPVTVLYYTVRQASTGNQCISVAVSAAPGGPFLDGSSGPLECGASGAIDPSPFVDANGNAFLLYKTERPSRLWSRPLAADGRSFTGPAKLLLAPSQPWEAGNVEAPSMLRQGGFYWLFYSGNDWNGRLYAEGIARCLGPSGPCAADPANPILTSKGNAAGPGGGEVFTDPTGAWWLAYHAYQEPFVRYPNSRLLHVGRITFDANGRPVISP
jgi:uncharacterized membrane-anchored protein YhcB (DUF1043 family)